MSAARRLHTLTHHGALAHHGWSTHHGRSTSPTLWLVVAITLLAFLTVQSRALSTSFVSAAPTILADDESAAIDDQIDARAAIPAERPDFQADLVGISDGQAGRPFSFAVQVRNAGNVAGAVRVSTILPPEFSNVRVNGPGFTCTRQFSASGPQAGTLVACTRSSLEGGAAALITIEANAPGAAGEYRLLATADPRDEVAAVVRVTS